MSAARVPGGGAARGQRGQRREVDVPQPGDVPAVGVVVVDRDDDGVRPLGLDRAQRLPEPGRVLHQLQDDAAPVDGERLAAAEGRGDTFARPASTVVGVEAEGEPERGGAAGVLGVVRALGAQHDVVVGAGDPQGRRRRVPGPGRACSSTAAGSCGHVHRAAVELLVVGEQLAQLRAPRRSS